MRVVPWWVWFDSRQEEREFKKMLNESKSDIEAIGKVMDKYPQLSMRSGERGVGKECRSRWSPYPSKTRLSL